MFIADQKGKLSLHEEVSEDFLTSSVFSVLNYLGGPYLERFLSYAINLAGERLSLQMPDPAYEFWPWFDNDAELGYGAEPDLVIYSGNFAVIIEAKNYSGKSGEGIGEVPDDRGERPGTTKILLDQLAREFLVGVHKVAGGRRHDRRVDHFYLIYLTRHHHIPDDDMMGAIKAVSAVSPSCSEEARRRLFWLEWSRLVPIIEQARDLWPESACEHKLAGDLLHFLERRGLGRFTGFSRLRASESISRLPLREHKPVFYRSERPRFWRRLEGIHLGDSHSPFFYKSRARRYWDFLQDWKLTTREAFIFYSGRQRYGK